ncbi:MAG: magnesium/cobalt transporter CorA [Alkalispirochaeta sp.]
MNGTRRNYRRIVHPRMRMPSWRRVRRETLGTPPGSLSPSRSDTPTHIHVITYTGESGGVFESHVDVAPGGTVPEIVTAPFEGIRWINVVGVHDGDLLREIGRAFGMHTLLLEDIQQTDQRPKFQESNRENTRSVTGEGELNAGGELRVGGEPPGRGEPRADGDKSWFFGVLRMISWHNEDETGAKGTDEAHLDVEQISLYSSGSTVISFQERPGDVFEGLRERIRTGRGRVRRSGVDYLFYAIVDAIIDTSFLVVDEMQERIEDTEDRIIATPQHAPLSIVHTLRGEVIAVRRALRPLREMLQTASTGDYGYFSEGTQPFLSDSYDHILTLIDGTDALMERISGLFQLHASIVGTSTNDVMRVLTIIATVFIPLTFIVGIYGMNFSYMPELTWRYGYPTVIGVMVMVAGVMIAYFKRQRWF